MLEGVIPLETFPLAEWQYGELADVPIFTVLKMQICVTRPQCVKLYVATKLQLVASVLVASLTFSFIRKSFICIT